MTKRLLALALLAIAFTTMYTSCVRPPQEGGRSGHHERHHGQPPHH
ncbi:hypothetical protein [Filimonas lacunae]|nr:hypothetical protein [Filimonas lacunae]BAV08200.1 hypothetical protein FLA_4233 [Filimonas lacunae]